MSQVRRGLGRGLDALIPATPREAPAASPGTEGAGTRAGLLELDLDLIAPNPEQPRTHFEPEQLRELADSIREHGILQPLLVSRDDRGGYRLIAGERRLQAARLAGLETVPVVLREAAAANLLELALIENIQRADLNAIEEALAYRRLTDEYGLTQEAVARRVGKSRAAVTNSLRLLGLEPELRRSLVAGEITEGHARALLGAHDASARLDAWRDVVRRGLSVRETEALVRRRAATAAAKPPARKAKRKNASAADIEGRLRRALSTRVTVSPRANGGARLVIDCFSAEELDNVLIQILGEDL